MTKARCITRIKRSFFPVLGLIFLFFGFGPAEIYFSNRGSTEFWFSYADLFLPLIFLSLGSFILLYIILLVLPTKGYHIFMAVIIAVTVLLFFQGFFLPNNYGSLNGQQIDWGKYTLRYIYNTLIWLIIICISILLCIKNWSTFRKVIQYIAISLIIIESISLLFVGLSNKETKTESVSGEVFLTTKNEFVLSNNQNTIVFILDAFDSSMMYQLMDEHLDEIKESFSDFVLYHNTSGGAIGTKYAIPFILTGKTNDTGGSYRSYLKESYQHSPLFQELRTGNYNTGIYEKAKKRFMAMNQ